MDALEIQDADAMGQRGPQKQAGLLWHKRGGWYRRYKGKPIYFGGGGAAETSEIRRADRKLKDKAYKRWLKYESDHHFGESRKEVERAAGRMQGLADTCRIILDNFDMENASPEEIEFLAAKLKFVAVKQSKRFSRDLESKLGVDERADPRNDGPTCKMVVDAYLEYLRNNASDQHYLDAHGRLNQWKATRVVQAKATGSNSANGAENGKKPTKRKRKKQPPAIPHWLDWVDPDLPIRQLTRDHFITYRDALNRLVKEGKAKQSTVNKMLTLVKAAFNKASIEKGITALGISDYVKTLVTRKSESADVKIFTREDVETMLSSFDSRWKAITLLALNCALSNVDIASVTWDEINWDEQYLDFTRNKNKGKRRTPLWDRTVRALKKWKSNCKSGTLVFPNEDGRPLITFARDSEGRVTSRNDNLSRQFRRRIRKLDLPYTFAVFRKSGPTVAKPNVDGETIEMLLGDASDKIWKKHYVQTYPENVAKAVAAIENYYFQLDEKGLKAS